MKSAAPTARVRTWIWAETIVRARIGTEGVADRIRDEIRSFPSEFLLFFPVSTKILLDDGKEHKREVRIEHNAGEHVLHDGNSVSRWRVFERAVPIQDEGALEDATHIHARESVPVAWAVPLRGRREEAGRFWAFFPTLTQTYVPGIVNAPWKLNTDRTAVIGGEWNKALMVEAARLIVESLPRLSTMDDPGRPLDAFPRQMERQDEIAAPLVKGILESLGNANVIPDATGRLRARAGTFAAPQGHQRSCCRLAITRRTTCSWPVRPLILLGKTKGKSAECLGGTAGTCRRGRGWLASPASLQRARLVRLRQQQQ